MSECNLPNHAHPDPRDGVACGTLQSIVNIAQGHDTADWADVLRLANGAIEYHDVDANTLTLRNIESGYDHPDWQGFGYLGARREATRSAQYEMDTRLLAIANRDHWTAEDLFFWMNSKDGRWYAELWVGRLSEALRERDIPNLTSPESLMRARAL